VNDPAVDSRTKFEQFRAKPQFDVWRISQQQAFKIFDAGWQAGREELMRWIPIDERLPKRGEMVLVFGDYWNIETYPYRLAEGMGKPPEKCFDCPGVTHWMPLPDPPVGALIGEKPSDGL
jgi:hypothetical protein